MLDCSQQNARLSNGLGTEQSDYFVHLKRYR